MPEDTGPKVRVAAPLRGFAQRCALLLLLSASIGLLMAERMNPKLFEEARIALSDTAAPILETLSRPAATISNIVGNVQELTNLRQDNLDLKAENARLLQWQQAARTLLAENDQLRTLMNFASDGAVKSVVGRVIGDASSPFIRSLLVNAGHREGIKPGHAAVTGDGLIGRVASAGERSSRVLLISDLNSRIPVLVEGSRARAMLAGDNTRRPRLTFFSANVEIEIGSRIVTSGHGGMFPTGIAIGTVTEIGDAGIRIQPFSKPDRLEYIRLVDFGLSGIIDEKHEPKTQRHGTAQ